jgi:nitroreductase
MPVDPTKLHAILEMACAAPSAGDLQSYRIIVVRDRAEREALVYAAHQQTFIAEAPVCLVFCADPARFRNRLWRTRREAVFGPGHHHRRRYAQLAVVAAGMGSTWVGYFEENKVREALGLEPGLIPLALLSLVIRRNCPNPVRAGDWMKS